MLGIVCSGGLAAAGEFHRLAAAAAGRAAFRLALFLPVGDEGAPTSGFLQDAVSLDHFVKAAKQAFAVFVVLARDEEQTGLLCGNAGAMAASNERLQLARSRGNRITRAPTAAIVGMTGTGLNATNRQGRGASAEALGPPVRKSKPRCPCVSSGTDTTSASKRRGQPDETPDSRCDTGTPLPMPKPSRRSPAFSVLADPEGWDGPDLAAIAWHYPGRGRCRCDGCFRPVWNVCHAPHLDRLLASKLRH